jgi:hypothetical protein
MVGQAQPGSSEAASIDDFSLFVKRVVMAPDISKLDADRQLQKSELEHDSLPRKAYTTTSFWRQSPAAMIHLCRHLQQ